MLFRPDDELVRRDPRLPGLRLVLDGEAFTSVLRGTVAAFRDATARPAYVRYKPGNRCLVSYAIEHGAGITHVHANAYSPARWRQRFAAPAADDRSDDTPHIVVPDQAVAITCFPDDDKLPALRRLWNPAERDAIVRKLVPGYSPPYATSIETLAYKPGRRYVGLLTGDSGRVVVKLYGKGGSETARVAARRLQPSAALRIARCIGRSRRHRALAFEWLAGESLAGLLAADRIEVEQLREVGAALAELHNQLGRSVVGRVPQEANVLSAVARGVGVLRPTLAIRAAKCAHAAAAAAGALGSPQQPIHGDFYAGQVLVGAPGIGILDLDRAAWGDPGFDLGNFVAHLEYAVIDGTLSAARKDAAAEMLIGGYEHAAADVGVRGRVQPHTAAGLLRLAERPFRARSIDWDERMAAILDRLDSLLADQGIRRPRPRPASDQSAEHAVPFGALDARVVERHLARLPRLHDRPRDLRVRAIRVARHKPGRRALIEYDLENLSDDAEECFTVIGKVRAKGVDARTCHLIEALWSAGFHSGSADGISVPEPLGVVPELNMWLQRKVPGTIATTCLEAGDGAAVGRRAAEVIHKLHRTVVEPWRCHSIDDELRILEERLLRVAAERPAWQSRLTALFEACRRVMHALPVSSNRPIHRDFHPGQLLLDIDRVYLLDLDLYAAGDAAVDVGNFLAHVAEFSLRTSGHPDRLAACEAALVNRFLELAPDVARESIDAYRTVSLARHVQISTLFTNRQPFTERILDYCESRLGLAATR